VKPRFGQHPREHVEACLDLAAVPLAVLAAERLGGDLLAHARSIRHYAGRVRLLILGDREPSYLTHREIDAALTLLPAGLDAGWTATDSRQARELVGVDAVWLLPGTPYRDEDAAYAAIRHCVESRTPFLGTCGGFQYACVELARMLAGVAGAAHAESDPDAPYPVLAPLACSLYGERRTVTPVPGTRLESICGAEPFDGFHFCGFGLSERFVPVLERAGVVISAHAPDAGVEGIELPEHPFFLATAFQPQVGSSETGVLHPLIGALLQAAASG
jgi:CTP synthase (UTP-ammonia lyase)